MADMITMDHLSEDLLLSNLELRFQKDIIYVCTSSHLLSVINIFYSKTYTGSILVAGMNITLYNNNIIIQSCSLHCI